MEIGNTEIEDGARMVQLGSLGVAEHHPDPATIEESEVGSGEEQGQTQRVTVECGGTGQVMNDDGNLADVLDAEARSGGVHGWFTSGSNLVSIANYIL